LAEEERFELSEDFHPRWFSRPVHSTALPPLRGSANLTTSGIGGKATKGGDSSECHGGFDTTSLRLTELQIFSPGGVGNILEGCAVSQVSSHRWFSRPVHSTALPPLRGSANLATSGIGGKATKGGDSSECHGRFDTTSLRLTKLQIFSQGGVSNILGGCAVSQVSAHRWFSRPVHSTALPLLRGSANLATSGIGGKAARDRESRDCHREIE
jgi:hypothetical protein